VVVDQTVDALADGIAIALQRKWDRETLAQYGHRRTWDNVAAEVESYLAECLSWQTVHIAKR
jgi:hypothetical protein